MPDKLTRLSPGPRGHREGTGRIDDGPTWQTVSTASTLTQHIEANMEIVPVADLFARATERDINVYFTICSTEKPSLKPAW